jgi:hypothetical protein
VSALRWAPPTPDTELAEWRSAQVTLEDGRLWHLEVATWGRTGWRWQVWGPGPSFLPVASGAAGTREAAMAEAEATARYRGCPL